MEKFPLGPIRMKKQEKKMSRREFLKKAAAAAAAAAGGNAVLSMMARELEKPGDGMTPETKKMAEELYDSMEMEKSLEEADRRKHESVYAAYGDLESFLRDYPSVKDNKEELAEARLYFEKNKRKK